MKSVADPTFEQAFHKKDQFDFDKWAATIGKVLDAGDIPSNVQQRLERTYAAFAKIPQEPPAYTRPTRRIFSVPAFTAAILACMLFAGVAFAATGLLSMGQGDGSFFANDKNLPVYISMEEGAKALSADVGQTALIDDTQVTFDSISCDRNVANLYFTLKREGGFDLQEASIYNGSKEAVWPRLQSLMPWLTYTLEDDAGTQVQGRLNNLDAYLEEGAIKCLMRITPEKMMGEEARINLDAFSFSTGEEARVFSIGLDLSDVPAPRVIEQQSITFDTSQGERRIGIERFTASELATVMVIRNDEVFTEDADGRPVGELPEDVLAPYELMITDDTGNTLIPVGAGDGSGIDLQGAHVIEYARLDPDARSISITPVMNTADDRVHQDEEHIIDLSVPGAKVETSEFGGYEVVSREVKDGSVAITLRPYGWVPGNGGEVLLLADEAPTFEETFTDPETGQSYTGEHSGLSVIKCDYETGDVRDMTFFYDATDAELEQLVRYRYYTYPAGTLAKEDCASVTIAFV